MTKLNKNLILYKQRSDDCWRITLSNYLQINPKKIPHFVKKYGDDYISETRRWLNKLKKSIVFIPFSSFLETGLKNNKNIFPQGKCIVYLETDEEDSPHSCLMIDGELYENQDGSYKSIGGYFIIYDI